MKTNRIYKIGLIGLLTILLPLRSLGQNDNIVSGTVADDMGPLMMATVVEMDADNRIVAHAVTDINGNFSLRVVNKKDKLQFSYVGCITQLLSIDRKVFNVLLKSQTTIEEVVIKAQKSTNTSGLSIPQREISNASQSIKMAEFEGLGITTVDEALQGRIAGLDIVFNSGNLGAGTSMRLRGVSSINGNTEPLIVVDGNVFESEEKSNFDFSSATEENFAQLLNVNPEDIDEITVLKDAAATAIWGSQGANGVIEIMTKRGAQGNTKVTYSYRFSGTYQPQGMKLLNGDDYTMLLKESYFNPRMNDDAANIRELNYDPSFSEYYQFAQNTDWRSQVIQLGQRHNHYLAISGGGEKANFRVSGGYDHEIGSIIAQELDRFSTRVALDYFVSDRIKIAANFSLTYTDNHKNSDNLLSIAYRKMPNMTIYERDVNGNNTNEYYQMLQVAQGSSKELDDQIGLVNPIASAWLAKNQEKTCKIVPEFILTYNLLGLHHTEHQLRYIGSVVLNVFDKYDDTFYPRELSTKSWATAGANSASSSSYKSMDVMTRHTLTFTPHFDNENHALSAMARFQASQGSSHSQFSSANNLPSSQIQSPAGVGLITGMNSYVGEWRSMYMTFSTHYAYQSKYMADFSVRWDGSTKFGPGKRWGTFPALSFRWNVIDEPFMKSFKNISMLSVRPGWGIVGSQPSSEYLYFSQYATGNPYIDMASVSPLNIRLNNLSWEQKTTWNIGFDFGMWDDLLTMDLNLYSQLTDDLLMRNRGIPGSSGYNSLSYSNVGSMRNNGWELNVNGNQLIKVGKFSLNANLTFANNQNEITEMEETVLESMNNDFSRSNGTYLSRIQLYNEFGSIYGFRYKGVYQYSNYSAEEIADESGPNAPVARNAKGEVVFNEKGKTTPMYFCWGTTAAYEFQGGDAIYEDINHDGNINELDIVYLGSSLPKVTGGFGFKLTYGRLSWNNQFNFRYGNKLVNMARMDAENMYSNNNQSRSVNWRWRKEGDITSIPRALYKYGYNFLGSDRFVEDGSFIRLNYTQLSYSVDPRHLKAYGLTQLSLYASANNLFLLTNYTGADPEVGYGGYGISTDNAQTPRSKSFTLGITVSF